MFKSFTTSQTKPTSYREEIVARKRLYRPYVTDGLKVYYDFANRASQQSGIAKAFNLAGDDATAIHYNGPVYTPNGNLTYMDYDGVDDKSLFTYDNSNVVDSITIEMITKITGYNGMMVGAATYDIWLNGGIGFNTGRGESRGITVAEANSNYNANTQFNYYTFVFKNDANESLIYINGELQTLAFVSGSAHNSPAVYDLTNATRANWMISSWPNGGQYANIDVAEFKLYDRELSAREVAYNYGVAKSRKGV
jgi:hypothetical protein